MDTLGDVRVQENSSIAEVPDLLQHSGRALCRTHVLETGRPHALFESAPNLTMTEPSRASGLHNTSAQPSGWTSNGSPALTTEPTENE